MGLWQSICAMLGGRIERPVQPELFPNAITPVTARFEASTASKRPDYDSPYLPSESWDDLLRTVDGLLPLRLDFRQGFLVEQTTGKFVNVANKHLRGVGVWTCRVRGDGRYSGEVWAGRIVNLVREPDNPHDKNAIAIENDRGDRVGYWNKGMASALAKVLDSGAPIQAVALGSSPPKIVAASPEIMAQLLGR